jgi:hypothetical protein
MDERPRPPWHPVPLVELSVLVGIVLIVVGFLDADSDRGKAMLVGGMLLGSLGGADTALREHFAGYRSHSAVLAGIPAVALAAVLYFVAAPWPVLALGAAAAFAGSFLLLARAYSRAG